MQVRVCWGNHDEGTSMLGWAALGGDRGRGRTELRLHGGEAQRTLVLLLLERRVDTVGAGLLAARAQLRVRSLEYLRFSEKRANNLVRFAYKTLKWDILTLERPRTY